MEYDSDKGRKWAFRNLISQANGDYVICEVFRLLYDELYTMPDGDKKKRVLTLLLDGFIMARKISDRLLYYKATYNDKTGKGGKGIPRVPGSRKARRGMRYERSKHDKNYSLLH